MRKERLHQTDRPAHSCTQTLAQIQRMKLLLLLLVALTDKYARAEDLSGKMFTFPVQNNRAHVKLITSKEEFGDITLCHRSITDLKRDHALFSLATPTNWDAFLVIWDEANEEMESHIMEYRAEFRGFDYKPNIWHSICTTWDSTSGLVQLWFNGKPSIPKYMDSLLAITGKPIIILGQDQDNYGGDFDLRQSFVGMMSDVHMWDYVLSGCEIQNYVDELNFTPGNVLNWKALKYQIKDKVKLEQKSPPCL